MRIFGVVFVSLALLIGAPSAHAVCDGGAPNAQVEPGEACDDGNAVNGDGCENDCTFTTGWECDFAINFSALTTEDHGGGSTSNWDIPSGAFFGTQTENTERPTVALFGADAFASVFDLTIRVDTSQDDDFIGFVLGYTPGEINDANADYLLIEWKQSSQSGADEGLRLYRVQGVPSTATQTNNGFWDKSGSSNFTLIDTLSTEGWDDNFTHTFTIDYQPGNLELTIDGVVVYDEPAPAGLFPNDLWPAGEIGFYGFSQEDVRYELISPRLSICGPICGDSVVLGDETCDGSADPLGLGTCNAECRYDLEIVDPADGGVVNDSTPEITGVADPGASVTVTWSNGGGDVASCTATADGNGDWACSAGTSLSDGDYTVEALGTDTAANTSTDEIQITVDTATNVTIAAPEDGETYGSPVTAASGTGEAGAELTLTVNGSALAPITIPGSGNWSITLPSALGNGSHTISATVEDEAGNTDSDSVSFDVDTETSVEIVAPADGALLNTPVSQVSGTGEAGADLTLTVNGTALSPITIPVSGNWSITLPSALGDGSHTVSAAVEDALGNTDSDSVSFDVDTQTSVEIDTPSDGALLDSPVSQIRGSGEPGAELVLTVDGSALPPITIPGSGNWTVNLPTALGDGPHTVSAAVEDAAGNTDSDSVSFTVDTQTSVEIDTPADNALLNVPVSQVSGTGEPGAELVLTVNGTALSPITIPGSGNWTVNLPTALEDGEHTVSASVEDAAGNTDSDSSTFEVDTETSVAITSPGDGVSLDTDVDEVSGTGEPGAQVTLTVNGNVLPPITVPGSGNWTVTLPNSVGNGTHTIVADIEDAAGNTDSDTVTFDVALPSFVRIEAPVAGPTQGPIATVSGSGEIGSDIEVLVDGVSVGTTTVVDDGSGNGVWSVTLAEPLSEDGDYTIVANSENPFGVDASDSVAVTIDTELEVAITSPTDGAVFDTPVTTVSGSGEPGAEVTVTIGGDTYGPVIVDGDGTWTLVLPEPLESGEYTITADSEDEAGNTATDGPITITIEVNACTDSDLNNCSDDASCTVTGPGTFTCECNEGFDGDGVTCEEIPIVDVEVPADGATVRTATPVFSGLANRDAPVALTILDDQGATVATTVVNADSEGNWVWSPDEEDALVEGDYTIVANVDLGNSLEPAVDTHDFAVDLSDAVVIETPADGDTVPTRPTVTGTSTPNATIEINIGGGVVGTTQADDNGQWVFTLPGTEPELPIGPATIIATDTDSGSDDQVDVIVERLPADVEITEPGDGEEVEGGTPTVVGTGEPGTTITIIIDGEEVGEVTVDENGDWTWTPEEPLPLGDNEIVARDDNGSEDSVTIIVTESEPQVGFDEVAMTGGRAFGACSQSRNPMPPLGMMFLIVFGVVASRRRLGASKQ